MGRDSGLFVFNIKASPHIASLPETRRTANHCPAPRILSPWLLKRAKQPACLAAFVTESLMASHDRSPPDMEIAVLLSRVFAAMDAAGDGKAQLSINQGMRAPPRRHGFSVLGAMISGPERAHEPIAN